MLIHTSRVLSAALACCLFGLLGGDAEAQKAPTPAAKKPLKVFVLVGQSNMQGHAHVRTLPYLGMSPETAPLLQAIQDGSGEPRVFDDIWISYLSSAGVKAGNLTTGFGADESKIGPELTFGTTMHQRLGEPFLIIKAAWGGKSLHTDFRPPSAGPYRFEDGVLDRLKAQGKDVAAVKAERAEATGVYYRQTIEHVNKVLADIKSVKPDFDPQQGYELAGFVWFQGWNDMVDQGVYPKRGEDGGYAQYGEVLAHLIRDVRKDLAAPNLPFVIGVMGIGGPTGQYSPSEQRYAKVHQNFRDAMAAPSKLDEFQGNVFTVLTEDCWDLELDRLIAKDNQLKNELKKLQAEGKLAKENWQTELDERRQQAFTDRQREMLTVGVSNAAFHYLGCSKILGRIGERFAQAIPLGKSE